MLAGLLRLSSGLWPGRATVAKGRGVLTAFRLGVGGVFYNQVARRGAVTYGGQWHRSVVTDSTQAPSTV
jgi:hypothetical protein